jgi:serine O-acetyltransferase
VYASTVRLGGKKNVGLRESQAGNSNADIVGGPVELSSFADLVKVVTEDSRTHSRDWSRPGFRALLMYRFGVWAKSLDRGSFLTHLRGRFLSMIYLMAHRYVRNHYAIELHREANIGRGVEFVHQGGITIHKYATIGDRCRIMNDVTVGNAGRGMTLEEAPIIEEDVVIGTGAKVLGRVRVGKDSRIGPNVVVFTNVLAGSTLVPTAPRIIRSPHTIDPLTASWKPGGGAPS